MSTRPPRIPVRISAELRTAEFVTAGATKNVSTGGVCVEIDRLIEEGTRLHVTLFVVEDDIETEGARGLALEATVQWTAEGERGHVVGLKFQDMDAATLAALESALTRLG